MSPPRLADWMIARAIGDSEAADSVLGDLYHEYRGRPRVVRDLWYLWEACRIAGGYTVERARRRTGRGRLTALTSALLTGWGVRQALRLWRRRPGFTWLTVMTLGLGIGATTAILSVVDRVMLQALPYPDPEELVSVWNTYPGWRNHEVLRAEWDRVPLSYPEYRDWRDGQTSFRAVAIYTTGDATLTGVGQPALVRFGAASPSLFPMLGVTPKLGRTFGTGEDGGGGVRVALVSQGFWQGRLGGTPDLSGRSLTLDGERYTVIGVLPPDFRIRAGSTPDVWVPAGLFGDADERGWHLYQGIARLKPGVTLDRAIADAGPLLSGHTDTLRRHVRIVPRQQEETAAARGPLILLLLAALVLMAIAAVNVATLFTAEAGRRRHEYATRRALGASRWQLARQLAVESGSIGLLGAVVGAGIALAGVPALLALAPAELGLPARVPLDLRLLAASGLLGALVGVVAGVGPGLTVGRAAPGAALTLRALGQDRSAARTQRGMIALQAALAVVLLVGAGLLGRTVLNLQAVDPGFRRENLIALQLPLSGPSTQPHVVLGLARDLTAQLGALPGVEAVALASPVPFGGEGGSSSFDIEGREVTARQKKPEAKRLTVTPGFHAALGIPVLDGRSFEAADREGGREVVVVSRSLAEQYWPGASAVGSFILRDDRRWEIVGVVGDVLLSDLTEEPAATFYFPFGQQPPTRFWVVLRSRLPVATLLPPVRTVIAAAAPDVALGRIAELGALVSQSAAPARYRAVLVAAFSLCALVLAGVGILGLTARMVAARRRELGIRAALGAQQRQITRSVMTTEAAALGLGIVAGVGLSAIAVRGLEGFLYGVSPWHPATFVQAAVLLAGLGLLASYLPARRAAEANPMEVLRTD